MLSMAARWHGWPSADSACRKCWPGFPNASGDGLSVDVESARDGGVATPGRLASGAGAVAARIAPRHRAPPWQGSAVSPERRRIHGCTVPTGPAPAMEGRDCPGSVGELAERGPDARRALRRGDRPGHAWHRRRGGRRARSAFRRTARPVPAVRVVPGRCRARRNCARRCWNWSARWAVNSMIHSGRVDDEHAPSRHQRAASAAFQSSHSGYPDLHHHGTSP